MQLSGESQLLPALCKVMSHDIYEHKRKIREIKKCAG